MREITIIGMFVIAVGVITTILGVAFLVTPFTMENGGLITILGMGTGAQGFDIPGSIFLGLICLPIGLLIGGLGFGGLLGGLLGRSTAPQSPKPSNSDEPIFE